MLSKAVFIHGHINLPYKTPFTTEFATSYLARLQPPQAKDAVRVRSVTQL